MCLAPSTWSSWFFLPVVFNLSPSSWACLGSGSITEAKRFSESRSLKRSPITLLLSSWNGLFPLDANSGLHL